MDMTITANHTRDAERLIWAGRRLTPAAERSLLGSRRVLREIPVR
jgi:hypothetical protein